jgi:AcrR family transcriptional regulator
MTESVIAHQLGYALPVGRWEPDARGRLELAAIELFRERGYAKTTVVDIAERAGLTERTFFRHFADKREVLFGGSDQLAQTLVDSLKSAPLDVAPIEAVIQALETVAGSLEERRDFDYVRARHAIVVENPEVRERELIKMAALAAAVTQALRARGVTEPAASLVAETGIAVFKIGFEQWVRAKKRQSFPKQVRAAYDALVAATAPARSTRDNRRRRTSEPGATAPAPLPRGARAR